MDRPEDNGRAPGEMASLRRPAGGDMAGLTDADSVKIGLLGLGQRLKALADRYEERPGAIDTGFLKPAGRAMDVEATITEVYRVMKSRVFTDESPLRGADFDLWEAFREQQDEFLEFYKHALNAVEVHRETLRYYRLVTDEAWLRPRHGDLEGVWQDNRAYMAERDECIAAISNFSGKFSAMLIALRS
jgi:hypothetical protein